MSNQFVTNKLSFNLWSDPCLHPGKSHCDWFAGKYFRVQAHWGSNLCKTSVGEEISLQDTSSPKSLFKWAR